MESEENPIDVLYELLVGRMNAFIEFNETAATLRIVEVLQLVDGLRVDEVKP